jgi:hypothetical protein
MALTDLALALLVRTAEQLEQQAVDLRSVVDEELTLSPQRVTTQEDDGADYYHYETRAALVPVIEAAHELERLSSDLRAQVSTHALESRYGREDLYAVLSKDFGAGDRLQEFGGTLKEIAYLSLPPLPQGDCATGFFKQEKNLYSMSLVQSLRYDAYLRGWRDCIFIAPPLLLEGEEARDDGERSEF